ncbi:hypothetical protein UZ73_04095 [Alcaligenes faecalis]|nr:hypothetical protein UZ73_04095 [Alcaligenes faecalis]
MRENTHKHAQSHGMFKYQRTKIISYVLLSCAFFIGFFNRFSPATFSSHIADSLELGLAVVGSIAALHFWVYTLMQVPAGMVVDRYGIRIPAVVGTLLSGLGTIILGSAQNYGMALLGPGLVGLGMSLVFVAIMKNNAIWFHGSKFGLITGLTMLIGTLGAVFSEAPSLLILGYVSWRQAFIGVGAVTLVLAVLIFCLWRAPDAGATEIPKTSKTVHQPPAGTWPSIVSNKQLALIMLAISGTNGTFYAFSGLWGTHLFTRAMSISVLDASMIITVALLIYGFSSLFFGKISDQLQTRKLFIWVSAFLNTLAWLCLMLIPSPGLYTAYLCFALIGLSSGVQVVVCFAAVKESVPANITGSAIAYVNMGVFLVTAIIQSLYGWLVSHLLSLSLSTDAAYIGGLSLAVIISLLGLLSSLGVRETYPRT